MSAPLISINWPSVYKSKDSGSAVPLPARMAQCTPDMKRAILAIDADLRPLGGKVVLSDLYRTYEMQYQAHMDYESGKKTAFSPPPGGSMHEAGRAFDVDLGQINVPLARFWEIAASHGMVPIIAQPVTSASEAWHFECRGSHQKVYDYYKAGKADNFKPAHAMAVSAILATGVQVDEIDNDIAALVQAALIRLGADPGAIDGRPGPKTLTAFNSRFNKEGASLGGGYTLTELSIMLKDPNESAELLERVHARLAHEFPQEYF